MNKIVYLPAFIVFLLTQACTKEVVLELPPFQQKIVVDGRIETGLPPLVILTKTQDLYGPTDFGALAGSFVNNAIITVSDGTSSIVLTEICANTIDPDLLPLVSELLGIEPDVILALNFCAYVGLDPNFVGQVGKTYSLNISLGDQVFTSETTLNPVPVVDSLYFKIEPNFTEHGFGWCVLNDNPNTYNGYFFQMRRIHLNSQGEPADAFFQSSISSAFDDTFFNGLTFKFGFGNIGSRRDEDTPSEFRGYFKTNDTVVIKFSSLDFPTFKFHELKYIQMSSGASPFASPTYIPTNIEGGAIGCWAGFSPRYDTLICVP
jgi:hypothetical protein